MCGIAGSISNLSEESLRETGRKMAQAIRHRGPDAEGIFTSESQGANLLLAHRRLAVLDLSDAGAQPMESSRFVLVFNGEIYNHLVIRRELEKCGERFRGRSDTETLLVAFERWGIRAALEKIAGMFAFAVWDKESRSLLLARDRMGEKPLYYGTSGGSFFFASELKALREHPHFAGKTSPDAIRMALTFGYIPAPHSVYSGIFKLKPAHLLEVKGNGTSGEQECYWDLGEVARRGLADPLRGDEAEGAMDEILQRVLQEELVADVPLGCFLSGGIDSSLISAGASRVHSGKLNTFSIGFSSRGYDESAYAREVASRIGSEHTELKVDGHGALDLVPRLAGIFDEPFGDVSALPSILLCRLARPHVTVALSGDGGDEAFGGYNRYVHGNRLWRKIGRFPGVLRKSAAAGIGLIGPGRLGAWVPFPYGEEKIRKLQLLAGAENPRDLYWKLMAQGLEAGSPYQEVEGNGDWGLPEFLPMELLDQRMYLPDDILVKVDRASMAASLEVRAPFLDHRIVEFSWRLPIEWKVRGGEGKFLLRRLLKNYLPDLDFSRPKTGFTPPVGDWIHGELREWSGDLLSRKSLEENGLPGAERIHALWKRQVEKPDSNALQLWPALMVQAWLRTHLPKSSR